MSKELKKLLNSKDKKVREAENALANLFRKIVAEQNVNALLWDKLVTLYLKSHLSRTAKNAKDIGQDKNNLNRALAKNAITYNNFIKALMILGPTKIKITITMEWKNKKATVNEVEIANPVAEIHESDE